MRNCTNMCNVVTKRGKGNPKCSAENIHLLYTDRVIANANLEIVVVSTVTFNAC